MAKVQQQELKPWLSAASPSGLSYQSRRVGHGDGHRLETRELLRKLMPVNPLGHNALISAVKPFLRITKPDIFTMEMTGNDCCHSH